MIIINDKKDCTGCDACFNICPSNCISMESDSEGFGYPMVNYINCIRCGLCIKVCPIISKIDVQNDPNAYACINMNEDIRLKSSSGGMFTLIAEQVIDNNGVVFGATFDKNFYVIHKYIEIKEELRELRGSKYVQSKIHDSYKQVKRFLEIGRQVLFSGTPCQVAGLKSYLQQDYDNLVCLDIICHGVPSPKLWKKYIKFRENDAGSQLQRISFRQKNNSWKQYSVLFSFANNTEYQETHDKDLYMQSFLKDICLRPSCYSCKFKTLHRQSDITLADFWGINIILPKMDDDKGTSLMFVNSDKGTTMLKRIKDKISYKEVDINQAVKYNSSAIKSVDYNLKRDNFFNNLDKISVEVLLNDFCNDRKN